MPVTGRWSRAAVITTVIAAVLVAVGGVAATAAGPPSTNPYASYQFAIGLSCVAMGAFVAWKRSRHPMGWLLLTAGATSWATFATASGVGWMMVHAPSQETLTRVILHIGGPDWLVSRWVFLILIPLAFPGGFGRSASARVLLWVSVVTIAVITFGHSALWTPEMFMGKPQIGIARIAERTLIPWANRILLIAALIAVALLLVRTVRAPSSRRRQHQWFALWTVVLLVPLLVNAYQAIVHDYGVDLGRYELWAMMALPVILTVGIMRDGLFDITVVLRRATVLTAVSLVALGIYAAAVWLVTTLTDSSRTTAAVVGAGVVAVTLSQVREAVQRVTARHLFGTRDDPYVTLSALGNRIEATPPGEQALQSVTDSITEQLRVPYAAVDLVLDDTVVRVAQSGMPTEHADRFALTHRGIALGTLIVGYRTPSEPFRDAERTLLGDLARQAGVLAHNASLTEALRHSRAVLLNAREEERRRIRADLHDGLGPTLATVALGLGAAAERLDGDTDLADLLTDLEQELQTAIADVRGLVYDLRPAALDDLGLIPAIRQHADNLTRRSADSSRPLRVEIDAPADLDRLPAAVEVAAYRVALEALTNVTRHARASLCRVHIETAGGLALTVEDDGVGVPERAPLGVGLRSMRERVEELGGRFGVHALTPSGTAVRAWLPLPPPASAPG